MPYKNKQDLYDYQIQRWIERKKLAIIYKGSKCTECGNEFPYPAMTFHHRDPELKEVTWNKLRLRSWDKIIEELDKCDLVCANCHFIMGSNLSS